MMVVMVYQPDGGRILAGGKRQRRVRSTRLAGGRNGRAMGLGLCDLAR